MPSSPSVHVCAVLWPGCSPYGRQGHRESLDLCQALLFLHRPFPSFTSVTELAMLSAHTPSVPPPTSSRHFLISHSHSVSILIITEEQLFLFFIADRSGFSVGNGSFIIINSTDEQICSVFFHQENPAEKNSDDS